MSLQIFARISEVMKSKLPYSSLRIVFQTKSMLISLFTFKDKTLFLCPGIVYLFQYGGCDATYVKIKQHFQIWIFQHLEVSALIRKRVKTGNISSRKVHHLFFNGSSDFDDFSALASHQNDFKVTLFERDF